MRKNIIGYLGVDAGLMYLGDPCYFVDRDIGKMPFENFIDKYLSSDLARFWPIENMAVGASKGIVVTTGWGDGVYPVTVRMKQGRVASVTIDFQV